MKLMSNTQTLFGRVALMELPNNKMLINGLYHDAVTLNPIKFKMLDYNNGSYQNTSPLSICSLPRFWARATFGEYQYPGNYLHNCKFTYPSKYNKNLVYLASINKENGSGLYIYEYDLRKEEIVNKNLRTASPTYDQGIFIFDESQKYLYGMLYYNWNGTADTRRCYFCWYDKQLKTQTFSSTWVVDYGNGCGLWSNDIYTFAFIGNNNTKVYSFGSLKKTDDPSTMATKYTFTISASVNLATAFPSSIRSYSIYNNYCFITTVGTTTSLAVKRIILNGNDGNITNVAVTTSPATALTPGDKSDRNIVIKTEFIGATNPYLLVAQFENHNTAEALGAAYSYVKVFSLDNDLLVLTQTQTIVDSIVMKGIFPLYDDWSVIACIYKTKFVIYVFNFTTGTYSLYETVNIAINGFGRDSYGRFWFVDTSNIIYNYNYLKKNTINIQYEKKSYLYQNSPINTYILVSSYDNNNARSAISTTLKITGNATFSDGTKSKTITTTTSSLINIGLIINDSNRFLITAT